MLSMTAGQLCSSGSSTGLAPCPAFPDADKLSLATAPHRQNVSLLLIPHPTDLLKTCPPLDNPNCLSWFSVYLFVRLVCLKIFFIVPVDNWVQERLPRARPQLPSPPALPGPESQHLCVSSTWVTEGYPSPRASSALPAGEMAVLSLPPSLMSGC